LSSNQNASARELQSFDDQQRQNQKLKFVYHLRTLLRNGRIAIVKVETNRMLCHAKNPIIHDSPAAGSANALLYGDWAKGDYGVLIRSPDQLDNDDTSRGIVNHTRKWGSELTMKLLPASFLHASMRASNLMFFRARWTAGVLIGSKFGWNTHGQQSSFDTSSLVNVSVCYPADAGTIQRAPIDKSAPSILFTDHGGGCHKRHRIENWCKKEVGSCLMDSSCHCTISSQRNHTSFGSVFAKLVANVRHIKPRAPTFHNCWYEVPLQLKDLVDASNSLYIHREEWSRIKKSKNYMGWTECPATSNADASTAVMDAIVIQVPVLDKGPNLCRLQDTKVAPNALGKLLYKLYRRYGHIPIIVLGQVQGMKQQDCERYWEGIDCDNGFRRFFFAQTFQFPDGSCLAQPPGCLDVFYFPDCTLVTTPDWCREQQRARGHLLLTDRSKDMLSLQQQHEHATILSDPRVDADFGIPTSQPQFLAEQCIMLLASTVAFILFLWSGRCSRTRNATTSRHHQNGIPPKVVFHFG
jgi:hypothetical protein